MNTQYKLHQLKVKILKSEMNETLKGELSNLVFDIQQSLVKESDTDTFIDFLLFLNAKGFINNHDVDFEKVSNEYLCNSLGGIQLHDNDVSKKSWLTSHTKI